MAEYTNLAERESAMLGQEFLTWLWYKSEAVNGLFKARGGEDFLAYVEQKVSVQGGEGDSKETATVSGQHSELSEAKMGLTTGKKVNKALIRFEQDGEVWTLQVKAEDFSLGTLKTPKVESTKDDDPDAVFLEKMYLVEKCLLFLDTLFTRFLELRLAPSKWEEELSAFRVWLQKPA